ncbi:MAG: glutathione synthase [Gammaproteobacteria bacterium]
MKIGFVMEPIPAKNLKKDSTLLLMFEAQNNGHDIYFIDSKNLFMKGNQPCCKYQKVEVSLNDTNFNVLSSSENTMNFFEVIMMRQDPPVDYSFIVNTMILEKAADSGVNVINNPSNLRNLNEKIFALNFPQFCPPTLITSDFEIFNNFLNENEHIVVKPLNSMGGDSIFQLKKDDEHLSEVYSKISRDSEVKFIAQKFLPEISIGDKRILVINGKVPKHAVLRTPPEGEFIGNLAAGGSASTIELNEEDKIIAKTVADKMLDFGLYIVGLDMIGNFLTEINLTSPTCFRELNDQAGENLAKIFIDELFGH